MVQQNSLPVRQEMLHRSRLNSLIHKGLQQPLLVLLAGPGYGKTQAMVDYLTEHKAQTLWLSLSRLDNLPTYFWDHFIRTVYHEYPELSTTLQMLEFPDTLDAFNTFMHLLAKVTQKQEQVIWVFDDFGEINDTQVKNFFRMMVEMNLRNFHLVLLSNQLTSTESIAFMTKRRYLILKDDLRFTDNEISSLYLTHGKSLTPEELHLIKHRTEGWPLALYLHVLQDNRTTPWEMPTRETTHPALSPMFEERFFSSYPRDQQLFLIKLSMLKFFTKELLIELWEMEISELDELWNHPFVTLDPATGKLCFHYIYHLFLMEKTYLLNNEEMKQFWQKSASHYSSTGEIIEAIYCYRKCGDHTNMLYNIIDSATSQFDISPKNSAYLLEHLNLLTPEEAQKHPIIDVIRALIYMNIKQFDKAEMLLVDLEQHLLDRDASELFAILGEAYAVRGLLHLQRGKEDFGNFFKKSVVYLPGGSNYIDKKKLRIYNTNTFFMSNNRPGAKERMERAIHECAPWMAKVLGGSMNGIEYLFSAEASYFSYQLKEAQQYAYRAIYKAEASNQYDLVCNAYCLLARIALILGDFPDINQHIEKIVAYTEQHQISILKEIRDTALAWYYSKMRDPKRTPKNIIAVTDAVQPIIHGRLQIVYANHLINTREYARLVGMLEYAKEPYSSYGIRPDYICMLIMIAIGYYHLGNDHAAVESLWSAYDVSYHNQLTTSFIEAGEHMCSLINLAKRQYTYSFTPEWLEFIYLHASNFAECSKKVRNAYKKQHPVKTASNNPLTKREREILQALSQGMTREEISVEYYISINTVKSTIRSIYNKLDANNRAEAVSIAIAHGFIEGYTPEY